MSVTVIKELQPWEFTERLLPAFKEITTRAGIEGNPKHFFPQWRRLMELKLARTWELPGAAIGVIVVPGLYTGILTALVIFWAATAEGKKNGNAMKLLRTAIKETKTSGCELLDIAAFKTSKGKAMQRLYRKLGCVEVETAFRLKL